MVRNKIKMFAQQKVTLPRGRHKIIILDEADRFVPYIQDLLILGHLRECRHILCLIMPPP